jgi:hypothetical protein
VAQGQARGASKRLVSQSNFVPNPSWRYRFAPLRTSIQVAALALPRPRLGTGSPPDLVSSRKPQ